MEKRRRIFAATGILFILFLAVTPVLYRTVSRKASSVVSEFQSFVKQELGLDVHVSSVSPSILSSLTLKGLEFFRPDGSLLMSAGKLEVAYSLPALLSGNNRHLLREIRLDKTRLSLVFPGDSATVERLKKIVGTGPSSTPPPFSVRLADSVFIIHDSFGGEYRADSTLITFSTREEIPVLSFLNGNYSIMTGADGISASGPLEFGLTFDTVLSSFRGRILAGYKGGTISVPGQNFEIFCDGTKIGISRPDSGGLAMNGLLDFGSKNLTVSADFRNFTPGSIALTSGGSRAVADLLGAVYNGKIRFSLPGFDPGRVEYSVDIEGPGSGAAGLTLKATGQGTDLAIAQARLVL
ncbi:MAG: hypothetical protein Q8O15_09960, partial [Rectinemataceae bacterium]|nr:hypothetical protein [Rectinemataceae bacterium]